LAKNITRAVTEVVEKHGKVIVLEDDIVTSNNFVKFMNDALDYYVHENKIWHISAHSEINFEQRKQNVQSSGGVKYYLHANYYEVVND